MRFKNISSVCKILTIIVFWTILPVQASPDDFKNSFTCSECHKGIFDQWSRSMHALAISDPIFRASYTKALLSDPKNREYCLDCHAPTTIWTKDFNLTRSISIEGVTCSFCHAVNKIDGNNYNINDGKEMEGPHGESHSDLQTEAHGTKISLLLPKSEFCAGCHEFSLNGVPISETYSEWKEGPYAEEGKQCQFCHMAPKSGFEPEKGTQKENTFGHIWSGGHSGQLLEKSMEMESNIKRTGNKAKVTLNITNVNVGHKIPSGFPSRKLILNFIASDGDGKIIYTDEKTYQKTLVDQYGNEIYDFWKAYSIASDNRIKPKETRVEVFEFDIPDGTNKLDIRASMTYQLDAEIMELSKETMKVEIARINETRLLFEAPVTTPRESPAIGWIITVMVFAVLIRKMKKSDNGGKTE